jgi:hypothetical protein
MNSYFVPAACNRARSVERVEPIVICSDSLGISVTNFLMITPMMGGRARVKEIDSHSTYMPPSFSSKRQ